MSHDDPRFATIPRRLTLLLELVSVMLQHKPLLVCTILPNIIGPALEPIKSWIAKDVLNRITKGDHAFALTTLLPYAWLAVGVFVGLSLLRLSEKITNRMLDDRLLIELQRIWFDRRGVGNPGEHVARAMNDCENARKVLDLFQKEIWVVVIGLPSVIIWQLSLGPELLPALLIAAVPPFLVALLFGRLIQRSSHSILKTVAGVGTAVADGDRKGLHAHQEVYYRHRIRFEIWKQSSETISEFAGWLGLVVILLLSAFGVWALVPAEVTAGEIGLFLVNLKLLTKPLNEITKVYNKTREGWPAVCRVLYPAADTAPELTVIPEAPQ